MTEEEKINDKERRIMSLYCMFCAQRGEEAHFPQEWETIDQNTRIKILYEACQKRTDITQTETYKQLS